MATPTWIPNQAGARAKMLRVLFDVANADADVGGGAGEMAMLQKIKVWRSTATPTTAASGQVAGDIIMDMTNNELFRYISSNTFVQITADT